MAQVHTVPPALLEALAACGGLRRYPARSVVVNEEDEGDAMYVIVSGRVKAFGVGEDGREVVYATQGPGETFGELSLFCGPRSASVMTLERTTCVVVPGSGIRSLLAEHPEFGEYLLHKVIGMVRSATEQVKGLALDSVYQRLARLLTTLAERDAHGDLVITERLTQQDIAERIGCSREMVSRILGQLVEGGYVESHRRRIVIRKRLPAGW